MKSTSSSKTLTSTGSPVRGIDWTDIFRKRPDLLPPGYAEIKRKIEEARLRKADK
jgi:hypothetical protein